ncbi:MAG: tetratricopeptide repeat protein [Rhodospirillales bacterium]|nr:tetratricopeptide repeat protein [Rhodospirillales bacterium]
MSIAEKAEDGGDLVAAASLYGQAIELEPAQAEPLIALGRISARMGDADRAAGFFAEAQSVAPDDADAMRGYASALLSLNYTEEAAEQFRRALQVRPGDPRALNGLGVAEDLLGRHADAQKSYRSGLAAAPGDHSIQNNLALSLALSGRHDEAIAMLRDIAAEPGYGARIRQNLALVYALSGRIDAAADVARQDLDPTQVQNNLAFYQSLQGLSGRALAQAVFFANMGGAAEASAQGIPDETDIAPAAVLNDDREALQAAFEQESAFATPVTYVTTLPTRERPAAAAAPEPAEKTPAETADADADADVGAAAPDPDPAPAPVLVVAQPAEASGVDDAAALPSAPAAAAEAPPPVVADLGADGEPAPATGLAAAAEAEHAPTPTPAPAELQAAATEDAGKAANKTVSFDDVAWRLRAYLDDDPTVPVPAVPVAPPAARDADEDSFPVAEQVVDAAEPEAPRDATEETERMAEKGTEADQAPTPPEQTPGPVAEQTQVAEAAAHATDTSPVEPAAPLHEAATPLHEAAAPRQFQLQLASVKTEDGARSEWNRIKPRIAPVLPDAEPRYVRAQVGNKGYFYRVRVDASSSYRKAQELCTAVSARDIGCLVVPPSD